MKYSFVLPAYKATFFREAVDSILSQTYKDFELIIVNDASPEDLDSIVKSYHDSRIQYYVNSENIGGKDLVAQWNHSISYAKGEYIIYVDSDDYIEPLMCETLYNAAKKHNADLCLSGICFVGGNMFSESGTDSRKVYFEEETVFEKEDMKNLLLGAIGALPHEPDDSRYGVSVCKNIFKTSVIREKGIRFLSEREILSEDTLFMVDYIKSAECAVGVSGAYYCYCRNEDSLSKAYKKDRFEKSIVFLDELEKRIADTIEKEEYKIYLDRLIQGFGRILCSQEIMHARDEKIKFSHLKKRLKEICTQDKIQDVLKSYPWYRLPVKQAAFAFAMKHQLFLLQKLMVILRDR